ncbi:hemolysin XhlA family protein [Clostridium autoethanogenum]|uniref:Hemolysin XhlA n=2 Tax=Clostridium autoethanogenum TaxID=84023 RepID=A0A3M0SWE8_9CLOT|nr:hemolysin XhlA family protein [Clostridium autoethanogenum]AGY77999.1 hemolysin XhlA family protein [Clostridium autoethanogenum DSM 10061]ALU38133.1 Hypothetical protein CLAU_3706 [Clostridium autoethanogenum DSM 10061]OVY50897.1 hemolysin XhlA [Clostridium autoethanogenum]RMD02727.1 hypothetical protein D9O40_05350 [Clostridium autoethanogenum]
MNNETMEMKVSEHDETLKDHGNRIGILEKSDTKQESQIEMLCEKIDKLIDNNNKWLYFAITTMVALLIKILFF